MHRYADLITMSTSFALHALDTAQAEATRRLQTTARTTDIKLLQMINLQKAIIAVGTFTLAEAALRRRESDEEGFVIALRALEEGNASELKQRFLNFKDAINALKHGNGRSYQQLLASEALPFEVKRSGQRFFHEGDVSEVQTLVKVDNSFVNGVAEVVRDLLTYVNARENKR